MRITARAWCEHAASALKTGLFAARFESSDTRELQHGHRARNSYSARAIDDISLAANRSGPQIAREFKLLRIPMQPLRCTDESLSPPGRKLDLTQPGDARAPGRFTGWAMLSAL